ncbi:MAG TPA: hypothetical protein VGN34_19595 [Ktedonobacteraceae bacterium]
MTQIVRETRIGEYTVSLDESGALRIATASLALTFPNEQAQALIQWLGTQQSNIGGTTPTATTTDSPEVADELPAQDPVEAVQGIIDEVIATTRANYPASLGIENRDRFIDQLTRDRRIKPYLSQGSVSSKQILLWVDQKLDTGEERVEELPAKKKRWSLF